MPTCEEPGPWGAKCLCGVRRRCRCAEFTPGARGEVREAQLGATSTLCAPWAGFFCAGRVAAEDEDIAPVAVIVSRAGFSQLGQGRSQSAGQLYALASGSGTG